MKSSTCFHRKKTYVFEASDDFNDFRVRSSTVNSWQMLNYSCVLDIFQLFKAEAPRKSVIIDPKLTVRNKTSHVLVCKLLKTYVFLRNWRLDTQAGCILSRKLHAFWGVDVSSSKLHTFCVEFSKTRRVFKHFCVFKHEAPREPPKPAWFYFPSQNTTILQIYQNLSFFNVDAWMPATVSTFYAKKCQSETWELRA